MSIVERLGEVRRRVSAAVAEAGRAQGDVLLIAVSKGVTEDAIREAYEAGQRDFGENYPQELEAKINALRELTDLRWHFIGNLQSNKVKKLVGRVTLVQSVSNVGVLQELERRSGEQQVTTRVLIEVNVAGERSKTGASIADAEKLVAKVGDCRWIEARGLMTIPPFGEPSVQYFKLLRSLRDEWGGVAKLPELSMGMSNDYGEAIGQGATMVRVGTAIFGERSARMGLSKEK